MLTSDADGPDATRRREEVARALAQVDAEGVAVVPVQEIEAWLLVDEAPIRAVVGGGRRAVADLGLPAASTVESVSDPKARLQQAVERAQQHKARRRRIRFDRVRARLLEALDPEGPVRQLPSFAQRVEDVEAAVQRLGARI